MLPPLSEHPIEWKPNQRQAGADQRGGKGIAHCVETPRQDSLPSPGECSSEKYHHGQGGLFDVCKLQTGVGEKQKDDLAAENRHQDRGRDNRQDDVPQGVLQALFHLRPFFFRHQPRHHRKRRHPGRLAENRYHHPHQRLAVEEPRDGGRNQKRAVPPHRPIIHKDKRKPKHDGHRKTEKLPEARMPQVEGETKLREEL